MERVWALEDEDMTHDMWVMPDGTAQSSLISIPDPDLHDSYPTLHAGASRPVNESGRIFHLAVDTSGQVMIDVFTFDDVSGDLVLVDRWPITGWDVTAEVHPDPQSDIQHVSADGLNVVAVCDFRDATGGVVAIQTAVFNLAGVLLDVFAHDTDPDVDIESLSTRTGSYTEDRFVYFWRELPVDEGTDAALTRVSLNDGAVTDLFTENDVYAASGGVFLPDGNGLVRIPGSGDFVMPDIGAPGLMRLESNGTPVWRVDSHTGDDVCGMAHSGRGSVWAFDLGFNDASEYRLADGGWVQTLTLPESMIHAWYPLAGGGWVQVIDAI